MWVAASEAEFPPCALCQPEWPIMTKRKQSQSCHSGDPQVAKASAKATAGAAANAPPMTLAAVPQSSTSPPAAPSINAQLVGCLQEMINGILSHAAFSGVQNLAANALGSGGQEARMAL